MSTDKDIFAMFLDLPLQDITQELGDPQDSRGPMRPDHLRSVRARQARRLGSLAFRACDVIFLTVLTAIVVVGISRRPFGQTAVAQVAPFLFGAPVIARVLRSTGLYQFARSERLGRHLLRVLAAAVGVGASVVALAAMLGAEGSAARAVWLWAGLAAIGLDILHTTWWVLVRRWRAAGWLTPNVVIVGTTLHAEHLISDAIERRDINVLGVFDDRLARSPRAILGVPVLGNIEALLNHRVMPYVDLVVVTVDPAATSRVREINSRLARLPNKVIMMVDQRAATARAAAVAQLADSPLAPLHGTADLDRKAFAKRIQDLVLGIPILVMLAPVLGLVAIAVKVSSPGPVLFRQRRHGFNNEEIVVWKFRTMRQESTDHRAELQVTAGDKRITRVGRILRKTSLDELPQLINVVRGEMSLVGPRPHAIGMKTGDVESALLLAEYAHRHRIKPGMTGWAAVNGSRGPLHHPADVERRVALDVEYIDRQSFWLDLKIMALTIPRLLGDRAIVR